MLNKKLLRDAQTTILVEKYAESVLRKLAQGAGQPQQQQQLGWGARIGQALIDTPWEIGKTLWRAGRQVVESPFQSTYALGGGGRQPAPGPEAGWGATVGHGVQQLAEMPFYVASGVGRMITNPWQSAQELVAMRDAQQARAGQAQAPATAQTQTSGQGATQTQGQRATQTPGQGSLQSNIASLPSPGDRQPSAIDEIFAMARPTQIETTADVKPAVGPATNQAKPIQPVGGKAPQKFQKTAQVVADAVPRTTNIGEAEAQLSPATRRRTEDWLDRLRQRWERVMPRGPWTMESGSQAEGQQFPAYRQYPANVSQ